MATWMVILAKWVAQCLIVGGAIWTTMLTLRSTDPVTGKRALSRLGRFTIAGLTAGFVAFALTDVKERMDANEQAQFAREQIQRLETLRQLQQELSGLQISWPLPPDFIPALNEAQQLGKLRNPNRPGEMADNYLWSALRTGEIQFSNKDLGSHIEGYVIDRDGGKMPLNYDKHSVEHAAFLYVARNIILNGGFWIESEDARRLIDFPSRRDGPRDIRIHRGRVVFTVRGPRISFAGLSDAAIAFGMHRREQPVLPHTMELKSLDRQFDWEQAFKLKWETRQIRTRDVFDQEFNPYKEAVEEFTAGPFKINGRFR